MSLAIEKVTGWAGDCDPAYPYGCVAEQLADGVQRAMDLPAEGGMQIALKARLEGMRSISALSAEVLTASRSVSIPLLSSQERDAWKLPLSNGFAIHPNEWMADMNRRVMLAQEGNRDSCNELESAQKELQSTREELQSTTQRLKASQEELGKIKKSMGWRLMRPFFKHGTTA